ncbi:MAG: hypothetical protein ACRC8S_18230 [Fimbriiglobus sp.]
MWLFRALEDVLRIQGQPLGLRRSLLWVVLGGMIYGATMGSYGGWSGERVLQIVYSSLKVPVLLSASMLLALPPFFVLNMLLGLAKDFPQALRAVVAGQGFVAVVLASLAPYVTVWYATVSDYQEAIVINGFLFMVASLTSQVLLRRQYLPLIADNRRHRWMLRLWLVMYCFVGVQMGWVLRPFVGHPGTPPTFVRTEAWGNAYVMLYQAVLGALT